MTSTNVPASDATHPPTGAPEPDATAHGEQVRVEGDAAPEPSQHGAADDPTDDTAPPAPPPPAPPQRTPLRVARGVLKTMRPKQWVKNVLVLAAPFAGGVLFSGGMIESLVVAFVAFSLAASGIYLVNDANDVAADRAHPTKRRRPVAAGIVPVQVAFMVAVVLLAAAVAISMLASVQLTVVVRSEEHTSELQSP